MRKFHDLDEFEKALVIIPAGCAILAGAIVLVSFVMSFIGKILF